MHIPKKYGESKVEKCPFCDKQSTMVNLQAIPVCREHKDTLLQQMRCVCGEGLDPRQGKYGTFFLCLKCGPQSMKKVFGTNVIKAVAKSKVTEPERYFKKEKDLLQRQRSEKERTLPMARSDDPRFFD